MLRPSYTEVPRGFGYSVLSVTFASVTQSLFTAFSWNAYCPVADDLSNRAFHLTSGSIAAKSVICVGSTVPLDLEEREAYLVAIQGAVAGGVQLVPFVGHVAYTNGLNEPVTVVDVLGGDGWSASGFCSVQHCGGFRLSPAAFTQWDPARAPVFGMAIFNPTAAAVSIDAAKVGVHVSRFGRSDTTLNVVT